MFSSDSLKKLLPAFIGAGVCVFFMQSGFLTFFFLVPLGFLSYRYNLRLVWAAVVFAVLGNLVFALWTAPPKGLPAWDILYFSVMTIIFSWITSPPDLPVKMSGSMRFIAGSCIGALLFAVIFLNAMSNPGFSGYLDSLINGLISLYRSGGSDVVETALLEYLTADVIVGAMKNVILRGGSLISCVFLFFVNYQVSIALVRLSSRGQKTRTNSFTAFHVDSRVIWVLSLSLLLVILTRMAKLEIPEIILWNILVLCIILYFAQGIGILQFLLTRIIKPTFPRFFLVVLFIILIFSPVINAILLAGVILLGIAENWAPFRAPKTKAP